MLRSRGEWFLCLCADRCIREGQELVRCRGVQRGDAQEGGTAGEGWPEGRGGATAWTPSPAGGALRSVRGRQGVGKRQQAEGKARGASTRSLLGTLSHWGHILGTSGFPEDPQVPMKVTREVSRDDLRSCEMETALAGRRPCRAKPAARSVSKLREETGGLDQAGAGGGNEKEQEVGRYPHPWVPRGKTATSGHPTSDTWVQNGLTLC